MTTRRILLGISLFLIVFGIYVLTFNGTFVSIDEALMFDSTESLVNRGDISMNYAFYNIGRGDAEIFEWQIPIEEICTPEDGNPWQSAKYEPFNYYLLAPFNWTAFNISSLSNIPLVLFFNVFVTALTAVSIYGFGVRLGYTDASAWITALLFATGTIALFYARQIYREPVGGFFLVWAFGLALIAKDYWSQERRSILWLILLVASMAAAIATKIVLVALVAGVVAILALTYIDFSDRKVIQRVAILGIPTAILFGGMILIANSGAFGYRPQQIISSILRQIGNPIFPITDGYALEGVLGYHISPGRSLWLYSPVLFLAIYGAVVLWRNQKRQQVIVMIACLFGFAYLYGWFTYKGWHGAWGWGPRYLLPLIPALSLLWLTPAIEKLLNTNWGQGLIVLFGVFGIIIQFAGIAVPMGNFYTEAYLAGQYMEQIPPDDYPDLENRWLGAIWDPEWTQAVYHLEHIDLDEYNGAWGHTENSTLPIALGVGSIAISLALVYVSSRDRQLPRAAVGAVTVFAVVWIGYTTFSTVNALDNDDRYPQEGSQLRTLVNDLNRAIDDDAIIFADHVKYLNTFQNFYKGSATAVMLPTAPAEFGVEADLDDPIEDQIGPGTTCAIDWSGESYSEIWFVSSASQFTQGHLRPIERYLAEQYFPVSDVTYHGNLRLLRFDTTPIPETASEIDQPINVELGGELRLRGADLPAGTTIEAGDGLPISLVWETIDVPSSDYSIGLYLLNSSGVVVAQRDSQPQAGFGNMLFWEPDTVYRDNHALALQEELPAGEYTIATKVYRWQDGSGLPIVGDPEDNDLVIITSVQVTND